MFKFRNVTPSSKEGGCECENVRQSMGGVGNCDFIEFFFYNLSAQPCEKAQLTTNAISHKYLPGHNNFSRS